jgi:hypothetical protein
MSRPLIPSLVVSDPRRSLDKRNFLLRPMNLARIIHDNNQVENNPSERQPSIAKTRRLPAGLTQHTTRYYGRVVCTPCELEQQLMT